MNRCVGLCRSFRSSLEKEPNSVLWYDSGLTLDTCLDSAASGPTSVSFFTSPLKLKTELEFVPDGSKLKRRL